MTLTQWPTLQESATDLHLMTPFTRISWWPSLDNPLTRVGLWPSLDDPLYNTDRTMDFTHSSTLRRKEKRIGWGGEPSTATTVKRTAPPLPSRCQTTRRQSSAKFSPMQRVKSNPRWLLWHSRRWTSSWKTWVDRSTSTDTIFMMKTWCHAYLKSRNSR